MEHSAGMPEAPIKLWLPGLGDVDPRVRRVIKAVRQYDESLRLQRHEITGDWVVTIGENGFPVYGFGRELPHPDDVEQILGRHDISRHGKRIMDELARAAERKRLDNEYRLSEVDGEMAEYFESAAHTLGGTSYHRSLPKRDPKQRSSGR